MFLMKDFMVEHEQHKHVEEKANRHKRTQDMRAVDTPDEKPRKKKRR